MLACVGVVSVVVWAAMKVEGGLLHASHAYCNSHECSTYYGSHESISYVLLHVWSGLMQECEQTCCVIIILSFPRFSSPFASIL